MLAIVKKRPGRGVDLEDRPMPSSSNGKVLVRVKTASICGSDLHIFRWDDEWTKQTVPLGGIIGHEFCGIAVEDCGSAGVRAGDLVTAEGHVACGRCPRCKSGEPYICPNEELLGFHLDGAFAEYISVPAANVIPIPGVSPEIGAFLDGLGNAVHACEKARTLGQSAFVSGCGPLGLMTVALLRLGGASWIGVSEPSAYRRKLAEKLDPEDIMSANLEDVVDGVMKATGGVGTDLCFEMSGEQGGLDSCLAAVRAGGKVILMGLPNRRCSVDTANQIVAKGVTVDGVVGRSPASWVKVLRFVKNKRTLERLGLERIITHKLPLSEAISAFEMSEDRVCGKVLLECA